MRRATLVLLLIVAAGCGLTGLGSGSDTSSERIEEFLASRRDAGVPEDPQIGPGDVIRVEVTGVEKASRRYTVSRGGSIRLPVAGEAKVGGKSVDEAAQEIARRLKSVVRDPVVQVKLIEVAGSEVTIEGAVQRPGRIRLGLAGRTLGDALSAAGGLTSDASGAIRITPGSSAGQQSIELAASDVLRDEEDGGVRLYLRPGDRIEVVSESGAIASVGPDPLAELGVPLEVASVPEVEEPARVEVKPVPGPVPAPVRSAPRVAPEEVVERPTPVVPAAPVSQAREPAPASAALRAELETLRRRAETNEVELRNQLRRAEAESAKHQREAESARAAAEESRLQLAAERERSAQLAARIAEIEAGRGGAAISIAAAEPSATESRSRGFFSFFGGDAEEADEDALPVEAPASIAPSREPRVAAPEPAAPPPPSARRPPANPPVVANTSADGRIRVVGRVQSEGSQRLAEAHTVTRAVIRAGLARDADVSRIEVRRAGGIGRIIVDLREVRAGRSPDVLLEDGDSIIVP